MVKPCSPAAASTPPASLRRAQYAWGKNVLRGQRQRQHDRPLSESRRSSELLQCRNTRRFLRALSSAILRPTTASSFSVRHELVPLRPSQRAVCSKRPASARPRTTSKRWESSPTSTSSLPNALADLRGMVRDNANDFHSNPHSTPIKVFQRNWFREGYFKGNDHHRPRTDMSGRPESSPTTLS